MSSKVVQNGYQTLSRLFFSRLDGKNLVSFVLVRVMSEVTEISEEFRMNMNADYEPVHGIEHCCTAEFYNEASFINKDSFFHLGLY